MAPSRQGKLKSDKGPLQRTFGGDQAILWAGEWSMPELPEMETYRRHLEQHCSGRRVTNLTVGRPKSLNLPVKAFRAAVQGAYLAGFARIGKHLVLELSTGAFLVNHLMLGGALFYGTEAEAPRRTFQVVLQLDNGRALWWSGLRLGWLHWVDRAELAARSAELGLDPLDAGFAESHLASILAGRRGQLKALLVHQRFFPGIGNCYADELCWAAGIHPLRVAGRLATAEEHRLWRAMKATLSEAVALGGYTETPFHAGDTFTGGYLPHLKVYDRGGEPCPRCGEKVIQAEASGRKLFFCPHCQPHAPGVESGRLVGETGLGGTLNRPL